MFLYVHGRTWFVVCWLLCDVFVCWLLSVVNCLLVGVCIWLFVVARFARFGCLLSCGLCCSLFVCLLMCCVVCLLCVRSRRCYCFFVRYVLLAGWCLLLFCVV